MASPVLDGTSRRARDRSARLAGLDYARFVAIIGMMSTHLWSAAGDEQKGVDPLLTAIMHGKASALFAVLAGVGITLTTRRYRDDPSRAMLTVLGRGVALLLIGLTLALLPWTPVVILAYYGLMFCVAAMVVPLRTRTLSIVAASAVILGPLASFFLRAGVLDLSTIVPTNWVGLTDPVTLLRDLTITGTYPVITWVGYAFIGMLVGRALLWARSMHDQLGSTALRLAGIGAAAAAIGWGISWTYYTLLGGAAQISTAVAHLEGIQHIDGVREVQPFFDGMDGTVIVEHPGFLLSPAPHSGTPIDLVITAGLAVMTIGLLVALGTVLGPRTTTIMSPIASAGSAPLTVYVCHVVAVSLVSILLPITGMDFPWYHDSLPLWLVHVAGALVIGSTLLLLGRKGPLETLVSHAGKLTARLARAPKV